MKASELALMGILTSTAFLCLIAHGKDQVARADTAPKVVEVGTVSEVSEVSEPTPVPQVETFTVLPSTTPKPTYKEVEELPSYKLPKKDVETLAKLLWSSPLRSNSEKSKLLWVVFNRIDKGLASSVEDAVTVSEFTFFDRKARVSDKNRDLVEQEMTRWMALKDGYGIGWHPSRKALYCRFVGENNRHIEIMSDPYGDAL